MPSSTLAIVARVLDWFHVAMRVQNLEQMIKGLPDRDERPSADTLIDGLRSAKWHLWHGCPYPALQRLESLGWELTTDGSPEETKLLAKLEGLSVTSRTISALS